MNILSYQGCCVYNHPRSTFKTASSTDLAYRKYSSLVSKYIVCVNSSCNIRSRFNKNAYFVKIIETIDFNR